MANANESPEMEVIIIGEVIREKEKPGDEENSKVSTKGADEAQGKTQKTQNKTANKVENGKKDSSGSSSVSRSYELLQTGLQDIAKSSTSQPPSSNSTATKPGGKKTSEGNGSKRKQEEGASGSSEDDYFDFIDFLDRTKTDYYCKVCDSHMNSEQMWGNHVQGKRHLKNIKKEPGEPLFKAKAVKTDLTPKINKVLDTVRMPVVGLDYMCELQKADGYLDPTYSCYLCQATCSVSGVVEHILGTKHRLAYLKEVDPNEYLLVEGMRVRKKHLTSITRFYAKEHERKSGRGKMEVKIEKPKMEPPPPKKKKRTIFEDLNDEDAYYRGKRLSSPTESDSPKKERYLFEDINDDDTYYRGRRLSPPMGSDWRHERDLWSPPVSSQPGMRPPYMTPQQPPDYAAISMKEKLHILRQVCINLIVVSESEGTEVKEVINSLTQSLLQFKIRVLPPQVQNTLARHIISGNTQALENTLGLGNSGMSNVGSVISSMAASGNFPMRIGRPLSPPISTPMHPNGIGGGHSRLGGMGGGMNLSDGLRGIWGPPGPSAHVSFAMQGGCRAIAYHNTSHLHGGMGGPFGGSDR